MCVWKEGVAFICVQYAACVHLSLSLRVSKSTKEMKKKFKQNEYTNAGNKTTEIHCEFTCCSNVYMCVKEVKILWLVKSCQPVSDYGTRGGTPIALPRWADCAWRTRDTKIFSRAALRGKLTLSLHLYLLHLPFFHLFPLSLLEKS